VGGLKLRKLITVSLQNVFYHEKQEILITF
jgi:hypothetical protein